MAATAEACQGVWFQNLLTEIIDMKCYPVIIYIDNKSTLDLARNPMFYGRCKHIDIPYLFIRECVERGEIIIKHVKPEESVLMC